jgi:outer membrane protein assembly factor BamC
MVEQVSKDGDTSTWVFGKEDQGLNAAMLARLMVFLGSNQKQAETQIAQAEKDPTQPKITKIENRPAELSISEPFDRAWRRVGIALDSAGFSVDDRNRSAGDYYISYLDTDTGEKIEQQTFFGRLFGTKNRAEATQYRLHVAQQGTDSLVTVLDKDGKQDTSDTAKRIIEVLSKHMGGAPAY